MFFIIRDEKSPTPLWSSVAWGHNSFKVISWQCGDLLLLHFFKKFDYFRKEKRVVGQPLHYYSPYDPVEPDHSRFSYFQRFEFLQGGEDMSNDLMHSPSSSQSDSDNSESSIDISRTRPKNEIRGQLRCCWKLCGIEFDSLELLANHVTRQHAASGAGGLFYCGWEGCTRNQRGFNARYKMLVHVRTHTNEKPHKCNECEKSFSRAENLKIHSRSHSGEKPYICTVPGCGKAYSNSSDRFKHSRTHQVEKPYCCKVPGCPKRYTDPSSLRKHVKTYKHFVNEPNIIHANPEYSVITENEHVTDIHRISGYQTNFCTNTNLSERIEPCNCPHFCSNNRLNQETDFADHEKFDVQENVINLSWKRFNEDLPPKQVFKNETLHQHLMDIDMPLDLSIHRYEV